MRAWLRTASMFRGEPAAGALSAGTVLQETYRVVGRIGQGGMGEVYEVAHARLEGRYALKLLREAAASEETRQRFKREARILSGLRHPHIVQVIDYSETPDGRPYLVMELLEGEDLAARLEREGAMPLARVVAIVRQMASALEAVHSREVVHRDLKPENVLLARVDGQTGDFVKLVDFGVSRVKNASLRITGGRAVLGTPHYMAPEQAQGSGADERSDQFALAAIAYELLANELAFDGADLATVLNKVAFAQPSRLTQPGGWLGEAVDGVLRRGLAKDPQARFPSVTAFATALEEASKGPVTMKIPPRRAAITRRAFSATPSARRWWWVLAAVPLAVLATIWLARPRPAARREAATIPEAKTAPPAMVPPPAVMAPPPPARPTVSAPPTVAAPQPEVPSPRTAPVHHTPRRHRPAAAPHERLYNDL